MRDSGFHWHTHLALLCAVALGSGCGGRTDMLLPGSSSVETAGAGGGTGGTSGSTGGSSSGGTAGSTGGTGGTGGIGGTGGTGGIGGAGGGAGFGGSAGGAACTSLGLSAGPIAFSANAYAHRAAPELSLTGGTTSTVAVAVAEMPVESPIGAAATMRVTGFQAWNDPWPDSLGSGSTAPFVVGVDQFSIDRGAEDDTIAIAYPASPQPPATYPTGVLFQPLLNVFQGSSANATSLIDAVAGHQLTRFVKTGTSGALVGVQQTLLSDNGQDQHELIFCNQPVGLDWGFCIPMAACGTDPVDADAMALAQGFVVAYASSRGFGECMNDDGIIGPPSRILTAFVGGPGGGYGPLPVEIEEPGDIVRFVRVIPHSAGAWLVYQYAGLNAEQPPPVMAMRLDEQGTVLLEPTPLLDGSQLFVEPAIAGIGDQLMIAWVDAFNPNGDAYIMMRVIDEAGTELAQNAYQSHAVSPRLTALGSPDGSHVLIGWSEQTGMDGAGEDQAYVARFTCGWGQI